MFDLDDMLHRLGLTSHQGKECFREEAANVKVSSREEVAALFPNVTLSDSPQIVYVPIRFCHSLPSINLRGRFFTPQTLDNSFASVRDALVNVDHQMKYGDGDSDTICGHIVCGRFDPYNKFKRQNEEAASSKDAKQFISWKNTCLASVAGRPQWNVHTTMRKLTSSIVANSFLSKMPKLACGNAFIS
jgi:hypothetical protein